MERPDHLNIELLVEKKYSNICYIYICLSDSAITKSYQHAYIFTAHKKIINNLKKLEITFLLDMYKFVLLVCRKVCTQYVIFPQYET